MSKKIAFFPTNHDNATLIRYAYMGGYEPIALLAPEINVLEGYDISKLDGGPNADIRLHIDYEEKILESDLVYFADCEEFQNNKLYIELMEYAKKQRKEVIMPNDVAKQLGVDLQKVCIEERDILADIDKFPKMLQIESPIISIFTIGEKCGQIQTELLARKYFLGKGYNVMQIGSHDFMKLVGCLNIPDIMFDSTIDPFKKAIIFNRFIHKHFKLKNPDIILIGVPHPVMKYNNNNLNGLGILPLIIQSALQSDIGIINMHFADYTVEFLEEVKQFCKYRLDIDTRYFGISNTSVLKNVDNPSKLEYLRLTSDFVNSNLVSGLGGEQFTIFPAYNEEEANNAFQKMEKELQGNLIQV
ncbi:TIGR04066 family peptide maturation system protein [Anaerocolumna sp.]|uniref:TIGR04066 family peptide maturation system protein n=1 Tax=Anaerocolumna sp. TaxID=2041569 RepID=UPI0028AA2E7E|nr:TIGR04066 family peptide maturation system protein [Anaerocolumna sp.]